MLRKTGREVLQEGRKRGETKEVSSIHQLAAIMLSDEPEPTQWEFICDPSENKLYMGRAGAAKTSTIVCAMLLRAILQPGFKGYFIRQHYNSMFSTVIERAQEMLERVSPSLLIERNKSPPMRWTIQCATGNGDVSYLTFSGMAELPKGFGCHAIAVDEADECEESAVNALRMRMREPGAHALMLACNPPDTNHWLYTAATGKNYKEQVVAKPWLKLFTPRDGENAKHLEEDYYTKHAHGMPEDLRQRFIHGAWGSVFPNQPVYKEFSSRLHVAEELKHVPHWPVLRFRDFGYRAPCCLFAQLNEHNGGLNILAEIQGEKEEVRAFEIRVQALSNRLYPGASFIDFGDPAVDQHKDTGSTLHMLASMGVRVNFIRSDLDQGIRTVRGVLERIVPAAPGEQPRPQLQILRTGAPILIRALRGGYGTNLQGKPIKDGYYDHTADALRYGIINIYDSSGGLKAMPQTSNFYGVTSLYDGRDDSAAATMEYQEELDT